MKNILLLLLPIILLISCGTNTTTENTSDSNPGEDKMTYDSIAAKKYGADDYGMRKYVIAFLKRGPNRDRSKEESAALQSAHMKNIGRMADEGKLVLAGPFYGDGDLRGLYVFNVETIAEAEALTNSDPAIQAGSLEMELKEWYGSAAVMAISDIHSTLRKVDITK